MSNARTLAGLVPDGLDSYEEGEVQYPLTLGTTVHTGGFGNKSARYIKIGNFVHYLCHFDTTTNTLSATGNVKINLPFPIYDLVSEASPRVFWKTMTYESTAYYNRTLYLIEGTSELLLYNDSVSSAVSAGSTSDRLIIRISITYQI